MIWHIDHPVSTLRDSSSVFPAERLRQRILISIAASTVVIGDLALIIPNRSNQVIDYLSGNSSGDRLIL